MDSRFENAFDIKATGRLNKLYVELLKQNPDWDTAERRHDLNHFFARLIFCFFAEHTGIFHAKALFTDPSHPMKSERLATPYRKTAALLGDKTSGASR